MTQASYHQNTQELNSKILRAWHLIEFFQAHTLGSPQKGPKTIKILTKEMLRCKNDVFPWFSNSVKESLKLNKKDEYIYKISLGLFDKAAISSLIETYFDQWFGQFSGCNAAVTPDKF